MPSQSDYERIKRIIIEPIQTLYGATLTTSFIEAATDDLSRFNNDTLTQAMTQVRRTCKVTPRLAHIVEACRKAGGERNLDTASAEAHYAALQQRDIDAVDMAADFLKSFVYSPLAQQARDDGWVNRLMAYAEESARLQARYITKAINPGYVQNVLMMGKMSLKDMQQRCRDFMSYCQQQAGTGVIEISVPGYLIAEWKAEAERFIAKSAA